MGRPRVAVHQHTERREQTRLVRSPETKAEGRFLHDVVATGGNHRARGKREGARVVVVLETPAGDVNRRGRWIEQFRPVAGCTMLMIL